MKQTKLNEFGLIPPLFNAERQGIAQKNKKTSSRRQQTKLVRWDHALDNN